MRSIPPAEVRSRTSGRSAPASARPIIPGPVARGFTLIELLIVVAIIAILAAIAVPNFLEAQVRSKVSRTRSDMRSVSIGLEAYHVDHREYPPGWIEVGNPTNFSGSELGLIAPRTLRLKGLTTPVAFLSSIPSDPFLVSADLGSEDKVVSYWHPEHADGHRIPNGQGLVGAFNTPDLFRDVPEEKTNYGGWVLTSAGPDGIVEPAQHQDPGATLPAYDPTNGTNSAGDIWRFRQ